VFPCPWCFLFFWKHGAGQVSSTAFVPELYNRGSAKEIAPRFIQSPRRRGRAGWRLLNCFGFAATTVFLLLPPLLSLEAQPGSVWDSAKLRFPPSPKGCGALY
jgi:hypothetical protein